MQNLDDEAATRIERDMSRTVANAPPDTDELPAGCMVGRYRIVRLLGRGGMGAVYLAERADREFDQRVALKLVGRAVPGGTLALRFRAERQILAQLNHPNIARLLDGGAGEDGAPYLAMEYVEGERIDAYCDARRLSVREQLRLFQQACSAIQYAHQNLVVHRDIKPTNILVTADGTLKLLDFGIAKLLDPQSTRTTDGLTRVYERMMTPEHASPEQVRGEPIGTASDVYSLGVLLYSLLSGARPYAVVGRSVDEFERVVCTVQPQKPSAAARERAGDAGGGAQLARTLAGDLDNIVLKAMHKEPQRRYASAAALADDIQNYLDERPVEARPDAWAYRAGKFLRRNAVAVSASSLALLLVVATVAFYTLRLSEERDRAELEARKSQQVAAFLTRIFRVADPTQGEGGKVTAIELLDRGAQDINTRLRDQPLVRAELLRTIGVSYKSLSSYNRADALLRESAAILSASGGERSREYAQTLAELGDLNRLQRKFRESEQLYQRALAIQERLFADAHEDTARTLREIGDLYREMDRPEEALEWLERGLAMSIALFGEEDLAVAHGRNNLALALQRRERYEEAEQQYREALRIRQGQLGEKHPHTLVTRFNLALLFGERARYSEQVAMLEEMLPLRRAALGAQHPSVGNTLVSLAAPLSSLGRYDDAAKALAEAEQIMRRKFGPASPRTAQVLRRRGQLDLTLGRYEDAERRLREAAQIEAVHYGEDSALAHRTRTLAAVALLGQGDYPQAETMLLTSYERLKALKGENSMDVTRTLEALGDVRIGQGRLDEAEALLKQALANNERIGGAENAENADALLALAEIALRRSDARAARQLSERAHNGLRKELPEAHWRVAFAQAMIGRSLLAMNDQQGAALLSAGVQRVFDVLPHDDPRVAVLADAARRSRVQQAQ